MIEKSTMQFLADLAQNNNREWFMTNRSRYDEARENFVDYCAQILKKLVLIQDDLKNTEIKDCIFRINRDVRFSKDKSPYKSYFSAAFGPGGRHSGQIDFYLQVQAGDASFLGGGLWQPGKEKLAAFRQEIDYNPTVIKTIILDQKFKKRFPFINGEKLKKAPKGYKEQHEDIELLKHKEMFFICKYVDQELMGAQAVEKLVQDCKILKPFLDYSNKI